MFLFCIAAFDEKLMEDTLTRLLAGEQVKVTEYDFVNHCQ